MKTIARLLVLLALCALALASTGCQTSDATVSIAPTIHYPSALAEQPTKPIKDAASAEEKADAAPATSPEGATTPGTAQDNTRPSPLAASASPPCVILVQISTDKSVPVTTTAAGAIGDEPTKGIFATARDWLASPLSGLLP